MKLKTITLIAAIAQLLALLCQSLQWVQMLVRLIGGNGSWHYEWPYVLSMPIYLFSGIMLVIFLFTLSARQKNN